MRIQINSSGLGFPIGHVVDVPDDGQGNPTEPFWRRRLRDAERDGCCEVVADKTVTVRRKRSRKTEEE